MSALKLNIADCPRSFFLRPPFEERDYCTYKWPPGTGTDVTSQMHDDECRHGISKQVSVVSGEGKNAVH
eukprot:scaffold2949_cov92-Skeletonema_dohrnii-CCMP3373.AAC.5